MFLLILDKNPYKAAELIPDRLKFKQLLELTQLLASCGITNQVKPIKQGKQICEWIKRNENIYFVYIFYSELLTWCESHIKMLPNTFIKFLCTRDFLWKEADKCRTPNEPIKTAIFRYVKEYAEFTEYESNSELPIEIAIEEYRKYVEWKEKQFKAKRGNNGYKQ